MIKITKDGLFSVDFNGILKTKSKNDRPFSAPASEEKRLVKMGVAEYIGAAANTAAPVAEKGEKEEAPATAAPAADDYEAMSYNDLQQLCAARGIGAKGKKKSVLVDLLKKDDADFDAESGDEVSDETPAPTFAGTGVV